MSHPAFRRPVSLIASLVLMLVGVVLAAPGPHAAPRREPVVMLNIDGAIGPASADYFVRALHKAEERNAPLVILRLDTPGGLDTSMREMIRAILASRVPVATWVAPSGARAASAGTYILYASHIAAMAPGTNLGAATPVSIGGPASGPGTGDEDQQGGGKGSTMEHKVTNDAAAYIRSLAEMRGRNVDWAEKAVREAASLSATAALRDGVIDIEAKSAEQLLSAVDGRTVNLAGGQVKLATRGAAIKELRPDWRTELLATITNPNIALILLTIGMYGLIFEFIYPGSMWPGTAGAICLLTGLYAMAVLPVNIAGLALIALGLGLGIAEAHTPTLGALGVAGAVSFALGATMLFDADMPAFRVAWPTIAGVTVASLAFVVSVARLAFSSRKHGVVSGREEMLGSTGVVEEWNGTAGYVLSHGERWQARSQEALDKGQPVRVVALDGLTLSVESEDDENGK